MSVSVIIALASDVAQIFVMAPPYGTGVPALHLTDDSRAPRASSSGADLMRAEPVWWSKGFRVMPR